MKINDFGQVTKILRLLAREGGCGGLCWSSHSVWVCPWVPPVTDSILEPGQAVPCASRACPGLFPGLPSPALVWSALPWVALDHQNVR